MSKVNGILERLEGDLGRLFRFKVFHVQSFYFYFSSEVKSQLHSVFLHKYPFFYWRTILTFATFAPPQHSCRDGNICVNTRLHEKRGSRTRRSQRAPRKQKFEGAATHTEHAAVHSWTHPRCWEAVEAVFKAWRWIGECPIRRGSRTRLLSLLHLNITAVAGNKQCAEHWVVIHHWSDTRVFAVNLLIREQLVMQQVLKKRTFRHVFYQKVILNAPMKVIVCFRVTRNFHPNAKSKTLKHLCMKKTTRETFLCHGGSLMWDTIVVCTCTAAWNTWWTQSKEGGEGRDYLWKCCQKL